MNSAIVDIVSYVTFIKIPTQMVKDEAIFGRFRLRRSSIRLLAWLSYQYRSKKSNPMKLKPNLPWCKDMKRWLSGYPELSDIVYFGDDFVDFKDDVPEKQREMIREYVIKNYKVTVMT